MDNLSSRMQGSEGHGTDDPQEGSGGGARGLAEWLADMKGMSASRRSEADGTCWIIHYRPEMLWRGCPPDAQDCSSALDDVQNGELQALAAHEPEAWTFLDTETLGLHSAPIFLVGYLTFAEGRPSVTQILAEDTTEEGAMLMACARRLRQSSVLLSFNGKSFDMPLLEKRARRWNVRLPDRSAHLHVDLLNHSRRLWRGRLPDCKLNTVESRICGRERQDDVPSSQVPRLYRLFTETRDARILAPILRHNAVDVASLVDVLCAAGGEEHSS